MIESNWNYMWRNDHAHKRNRIDVGFRIMKLISLRKYCSLETLLNWKKMYQLLFPGLPLEKGGGETFSSLVSLASHLTCTSNLPPISQMHWWKLTPGLTKSDSSSPFCLGLHQIQVIERDKNRNCFLEKEYREKKGNFHGKALLCFFKDVHVSVH